MYYVFYCILDAKSNPILDGLVSNSRSSRKLALAQSSLFAIDATNYDFTAALSVNDSKFHQKIFGQVDNSNSTKTSDTQVVVTQSNNNVEWNRIVQHECMNSVTNLIHYVAEKHPEALGPDVVNTIKSFLLSSSGLHKNIKLFFCGAILKCKSIFKSYAADLVDPIINMIVQKYFGFNLNYFMKDILIMLLEWHEVSEPSPDLLKNLLSFIIPIIKPSDNRKDLFSQNLKLLETIVHRWVKESDCELPFDKIKQLLEEERPTSGLMVCKAILVGGKIPCNSQNLNELIRLIVKCFLHTSKEVYILSGDVCGLILRKLEDMHFSDMGTAVEYVSKHLKREMQKSQPLNFLLILKSIQKYFPQIINQSEYKTKVLELLHDKNVKAEALDIIPGALAWEIKNKEGESNSERKRCAESYLSDLEGRGIFRSSTNKSEKEIKALVKILEKLGDYLEEPKLLTFINQLEKVESCTDLELKSLYAETLSRIFFKFGGRRRDSILSIRILKVFSKLYSIKDSDEKVDEKLKEIVNNFWKKCIQSWEHSPTLILELLELLCNERNSIPIIVDLITKKCAESPEYLKDIFSSPLSKDCLYEKYDLNTSWRVKSTFQPMFAESFSTLSQQVPNFPATLKSALFSQRQGTGTVGMNILKSMAAGKLRYTPTAPNQNYEDSMEIDSSFTAAGSFNESDFYADFDSESKIQEEDSSDILADLRKRFYQFPSSSSQQQNSFYHAQREVEKQEALVRKNIENVREKQSGVKLVRSYRIGELPDIMMKHSEFLITISTLAKMNEELGRKFLVHLFTHFINEMRDDKKRFCETASTCFDSILEKYATLTDMSPQFAGLILEISTMNNMISIKPSLISDLGLNYHLEKLAIFKFESILSDSANNNNNKVLNIKEKGAKRARVVDEETKNKEEADTLLRIAEQYKELEDSDIIRSVFHMAEKLETESSHVYKNGVLALTAENEGKYPDALELYSKLYCAESEEPENYNKKRAIFWDTACYKCFRQLSQWGDMFDRTDKFLLEGNLDSDDIDFNYVQYHRITSAVQILVRDQSPEDEEPEIIGRVRKYLGEVIGAEESEFIRIVDMFPIDIAVALTVFRASGSPRIFDILENYSEKSLLENFKFFDKISRKETKEHLLNLQRNSILLDYLDFYWCQDKKSSVEDFQTTTTQIISKWNHPGKSKFTPLINYDIIVAQKDNFITSMALYVEDEMMETYEEKTEELRCINYEQNMWLAELGILNGNSVITLDALKKASKIGTAIESDYKLQVISMKLKYLLAFGPEMDEVNWTSIWKKGWQKMRKYTDSSTVLEMKTSLLQCLISRQLADPLSTVEELKQTLEIPKATTLEDYTCNEITRLFKTISSKSGSSGGLYMKMFKLLNTVGKLYTDRCSNEQNASLEKESAVCLLRGMMNGDSEAQHLFPSLFPTLEKYPEFIPTFKELVSFVPSWMFLPWLDQIVGNLNRSTYIQDALSNIIDRLLDDYPQAFQLQYTQLHSRKNFPDLFKIFADALDAVVLPSILFKKYTSQDGLLSIHPSKTNAVENCRSFQQKLMEIKSNSQIYGDIHQNFAKKVLTELEKYMKELEQKEANFENNEEMLEPADDDKYKAKWLAFIKFVETAQGKIPECIGLKSLSPWLNNFRSSAFRDHLEVPGQYSKFEKPNTNLHPMIVSFLPTVNVLPSLTKPIKLTITANTGKDVRFLVKKGDDLKQDKRIEQCFQVVNEIFKTDSFCRERRMQISTYSVIPCSSDFGLIEWVDNCKSLKDLICSTPELKRLYDKVGTYVQKKISGVYEAKKHSTSFKLPLHVFAEQASRAGAEKMFDEFKAKFPEGVLKKKIMDGCSSLEHFFVVRDKMIRSYASLCFAHWILGIGDRHLENCLVSYKTGQFLGIDFGRAFGFTIIRQVVPELVPFRLTPQIENFFSPYGSKGLFKETMIYAKRSLTKSADLMEAVIDIFVQDPSVDWLENVKPTKDMPIVQAKKGNWNPMEIIKMKLHSENPIHIIDKDIENMPSELRRIYSRVLKSGRDSSLMSKTELDDEEYVDTLIDIAQDKSILVRIYEGWSSWI